VAGFVGIRNERELNRNRVRFNDSIQSDLLPL